MSLSGGLLHVVFTDTINIAYSQDVFNINNNVDVTFKLLVFGNPGH